MLFDVCSVEFVEFTSVSVVPASVCVAVVFSVWLSVAVVSVVAFHFSSGLSGLVG